MAVRRYFAFTVTIEPPRIRSGLIFLPRGIFLNQGRQKKLKVRAWTSRKLSLRAFHLCRWLPFMKNGSERPSLGQKSPPLTWTIELL